MKNNKFFGNLLLIIGLFATIFFVICIFVYILFELFGAAIFDKFGLVDLIDISLIGAYISAGIVIIVLVIGNHYDIF